MNSVWPVTLWDMFGLKYSQMLRNGWGPEETLLGELVSR